MCLGFVGWLVVGGFFVCLFFLWGCYSVVQPSKKTHNHIVEFTDRLEE